MSKDEAEETEENAMSMTNEKWRDKLFLAIGVLFLIVGIIIMTQEETKASTTPSESYRIQCSQEDAARFYSE